MNKNIQKKLLEGREGVYQQAQLLVAKAGKVIESQCVGHQNEDQKYYDLASLTKPLCTALLFFCAEKGGKVSIDQKVSSLYPTKNLEHISFRELLSHQSGLMDHYPFYKQFICETSPGFIKVKELIISQILNDASLLTGNKTTTYSDLGYIILGDALEKIYDKPLNQLFKQKISEVLGIESGIFFRSLETDESVDPELFIPSEICELRGKTIQSEVMDRNAYVMGGVSGHAGLFGHAQAIHKILCELRKAQSGDSGLMSQQAFAAYCHPDPNRDWTQAGFTLGFDTHTKGISQAGQQFSKNTIGHLGYAGTSFWWDLEQDFWIIFLSNRCMPKRTNKAISKFRPELHDLVVKELLG